MKKKFGVGDKQDHEAPEENKMVDTECPSDHPALSEGVNKHFQETPSKSVQTVVGFS